MANLILALLLILTNKSNAVSVTTVEEPLAGSYSSIWDLTPLCEEKRFKVKTTCYGATQNEKNCLESLKTGLPLMASGAMPSSFPNKMERCFETVLDFNCSDASNRNKIGIGRDVATSFGRPWPPQWETDFKRITPFNLESLMKYDVDLASPDSEFVYDLPQLNYESGSQALLVSVQVKRHTFQLHLNERSKRSERVIRAYAELPSNIQGNVKDYFRFVSKFGTHFRYYAIMGGRWIAMFSPTSYATFAKLNTWKNNLEVEVGEGVIHLLHGGSFKEEFTLTFEDQSVWETQVETLFHGGSITEQGYDRKDKQKQYNKWLDSVYDNPSPLYSKFIPLNDFLNGGDLAKYNSLGTMIKYEEAHNELKKRLFQMNLFTERNSLGDYLKTLMERQLQYICASPGLQQILQGMADEKNFKLTKLGLKLKTQTFCEKQKTTCRRKAYKLPLSPGICFNFSLKLKNITDVKMIFPRDGNCFSIYQEKNCKGRRVDFVTKEEIKNEIGSAASISFCPFCLKEGLQRYLDRTEKPKFVVHPLTIQKTPPVATLTVNNLNNELKQKMMKMTAFNLGI